MNAERRLVLVRHAKSAYPHGVPDHERPLTGKGRLRAQAAGRWLVTEGPRVGMVLSSDATRARHTWEIIRAELVSAGAGQAPQERIVPALYGAWPEELLDIVRDLPDDLSTVMVVGHEPTMSGVTRALAGPGSDPLAVAAVAAQFATAAVAVLRLSGRWAEVAPGRARLEAFARPRI